MDGLFGIGLSKNVREPYHTLIETVNQWRERREDRQVWAVDVPSGLSSDTGQPLGCVLKADYTVTFGYMKQGMILYPGRELAGKCFVEDIVFSEKSLEVHPAAVFTCHVQDFEQLPDSKSDSSE